MTNKDLEKYILDHTESEDDLLRELNRQTHLKVLLPRMLSGELQGKILELLSKMIRPKYILELGTYTGYSALSMVKGLQEGGELHTIELNDELQKFTQSFFERSERSEDIVFHIGDANEIVPTIEREFDLVFIDADKRQYLDYYHLVFDKVTKGGFIIADNVLWSGKVVEPLQKKDYYTKGILEFNDFVHNDLRVENVIFPFRDGLMVLRKK